jgi:short-subunit dehydrogenase
MRALVTGAAAGLGRALTDQLLASGHEVVAVDLDGETLDRLALESRSALISRPLDLANGRAIESFLIRHKADTFDLVILNAGVSAAGRFEDIPLERHLAVTDINLKAPIKLASALVGAGVMAERSSLIFISSLSHVTGYPGASVYAASKDGLAVYADSVRKPWKKKGIRVTTIFPGPIRTDHAARYAPAGASAKRRMAPEKLASIILKAARKGPAELFPGGRAARFAAKIAPRAVLRGLRKALLDKMDEPRL